MRVVDDIGNAVMRAKGVLHRMHSAPLPLSDAVVEAVVQPLNLPRAVVDAMLRVEVTVEVAYEIDRFTYGHRLGFHRDRERKLCGVSVYQVEHTLPSSGWRIINPFEARS